MSSKRFWCSLLCVLVVVAPWVSGEEITLEQVQQAVLIHHPLTEQLPLIEQIARAGLDLANFQYYPKASISSQATNQSETTSSPLSTTKADTVQWRFRGDATQMIFDGGQVEAQKKAVRAESTVARGQVEVGLEAIRSQAKQVYFTIILMDTQISQVRLLTKELSDNLARRTAQLANGIGIRSDVEALQVEVLNTKAKEVELLTKREGALLALSEATGLTLTTATKFIRPVVQRVPNTEVSRERKEFQLYEGQTLAKEAERAALQAGLLPRLSAFAQVGYSKPGLNAFNTDPASWWLVGIQASVALDNLYTYEAASRKIEAGEKRIAADRAQFVLTENLRLQQKLAEIHHLEEAIAIDEQIITLRKSIKAAAEAKSANGVISVTDLVREFNEENLAEEAKALHEVQLLLAQSEWNQIIGKEVGPL